jgi:pyruvate formate lyase activating enzyme
MRPEGAHGLPVSDCSSGGAPRSLRVGGFTPFTNIDYPGRLAAVVFVQGCPWRCLYCHNPHLQPRADGMRGTNLTWPDVLGTLQKRRRMLDAVVFSGGEPTMDPGLRQAMLDVRSLGYAVGLHTAGMYTRRLQDVLPLVDWVGFDVKAPLDDIGTGVHDRVVGVEGGRRAVLASQEAVLRSGVACEFRTTAHPALLSDAELLRLAEALAHRGATAYALQVARPVGHAAQGLDAVGADYPAPATLARLRELMPSFVLRRD